MARVVDVMAAATGATEVATAVAMVVATAEVGDAMAVLDMAAMVATDVMADVTVTAMAGPI